MSVLKFMKNHPDAILPRYATDGAGCFDLRAVDVRIPTKVYSGSPITFRTGLVPEIPAGWMMLIFSRSGTGFGMDTRLANCVGCIDSDYRGEIHVKLTRDSAQSDPLMVFNGDRIAQGLMVKADQWAFEFADELSDTARGSGGFGSTGSK